MVVSACHDLRHLALLSEIITMLFLELCKFEARIGFRLLNIIAGVREIPGVFESVHQTFHPRR